MSRRISRTLASGRASGRASGLGSRRHRGAWVWALALGVGLLSGCAKRASESAAPAPPRDTYDYAVGESSVEDLERTLVAEENQLRAAGVALPTGPSTAFAGSTESVDAEAGGDAADPSPAAEEAESVAVGGVSGGDLSASKDRRRCTNVCDLSRSICDLEAQICSLAQRHVDDRRYSEVCERAAADCRVAQEACNACT